VEDVFRKLDTNLAEARFIVDEIKSILSNPLTTDRSIGVVSLLGDEQALKIWDMLTEDEEIGPEKIEQHRITCGNPRVFQGKERDIMFLTMIVDSTQCTALSGAMYEQRFNVAASRARDRMYLVRSVEKEHLSQADKLRRGLLQHFSSPYAQDETRVVDLRKLCESPFEHEVYDELIKRGYRVVPQVKVGSYRIDMVVEGHNDLRLAVECDGDRYHGPDKWADDMQRQRILERAGWIFWRCFASSFVRRRNDMVADLLRTLAECGIEPIGSENASRSVHTDLRHFSSTKIVTWVQV
jgi:very-short-patch-repair endonuclease